MRAAWESYGNPCSYSSHGKARRESGSACPYPGASSSKSHHGKAEPSCDTSCTYRACPLHGSLRIAGSSPARFGGARLSSPEGEASEGRDSLCRSPIRDTASKRSCSSLPYARGSCSIGQGGACSCHDRPRRRLSRGTRCTFASFQPRPCRESGAKSQRGLTASRRDGMRHRTPAYGTSGRSRYC